MKYIILAAGRGSRMGLYTKQTPKILLQFGRYSLLKYHTMYTDLAKISDIILVSGYKNKLITHPGIKYYINRKYDETNMVYSLMLAREEFDDDIVVAYGDILYKPDYLQGIAKSKGAFVVTTDVNWEKYWLMRYGNLTEDTESLFINKCGLIEDIGQPVEKGELPDGRYVGLLKFSKNGLRKICNIYDANPRRWKKAYMTDLLQELVKHNTHVYPYKVENGWLEFDTEKDYTQAMKWMADGRLKKELNLFD